MCIFYSLTTDIPFCHIDKFPCIILNVYKNTRDVSKTRSKTNVSLNNMITSKSCQDAARYVKIN